MTNPLFASIMKTLGLDPGVMAESANAMIELAKSVDMRLQLITAQNDLIIRMIEARVPYASAERQKETNGVGRGPAVIELEANPDDRN